MATFFPMTASLAIIALGWIPLGEKASVSNIKEARWLKAREGFSVRIIDLPETSTLRGVRIAEAFVVLESGIYLGLAMNVRSPCLASLIPLRPVMTRCRSPMTSPLTMAAISAKVLRIIPFADVSFFWLFGIQVFEDIFGQIKAFISKNKDAVIQDDGITILFGVTADDLLDLQENFADFFIAFFSQVRLFLTVIFQELVLHFFNLIFGSFFLVLFEQSKFSLRLADLLDLRLAFLLVCLVFPLEDLIVFFRLVIFVEQPAQVNIAYLDLVLGERRCYPGQKYHRR